MKTPDPHKGKKRLLRRALPAVAAMTAIAAAGAAILGFIESREEPGIWSSRSNHSMSVAAQLEGIAAAGDDFVYQSYQLTERWKNEPKSLEVVEAILRFMEGHPEIDYGAPGPLVHFVETFANYEEKLVESVGRQPTPDTVGMLNRVINGKRNPQERRAVLLAMKRVLENAAADTMTRNRASDYLEFQTRRHPE